MNKLELSAAEIDSLYTNWNTNYTPGSSLGVIKDSDFIIKKNYGLRNLDTKEPISSETIFEIASVSKQFTAACIA
ncbi:MAG: serine hydrolase, partial [Asgard group archaeon]|nr:serine hydrolase [Asgard group archaeon]